MSSKMFKPFFSRKEITFLEENIPGFVPGGQRVEGPNCTIYAESCEKLILSCNFKSPDVVFFVKGVWLSLDVRLLNTGLGLGSAYITRNLSNLTS